MTAQLDAIVLAGDRTASVNFAQRNKLFLELAGLPLLAYVLRALGGVRRVAKITVVGPAAQIEDLLRSLPADLTAGTPVAVLEQSDTAYQNFWSAFIHGIPGYTPGAEDSDPELANRMVLAVPSDTPLMSSAELDQFLDRADMQQLDYGIGMTAHRHLLPFYPTADKPGIEMSYLHLGDDSLRVNNLHIIRPFRVANRHYIETAYELRYQRKPLNMLKVLFEMLRIPGFGPGAVWLYLLYQFAMACRSLGWQRGLMAARRRISRAEVTRLACLLLGTRVGIVETSIGGCAVDVDNADDYETLQSRFPEFEQTVQQQIRLDLRDS